MIDDFCVGVNVKECLNLTDVGWWCIRCV